MQTYADRVAALQQIARQLTDAGRPASTLRSAVLDMVAILSQAAGPFTLRRDGIERDEIHTANGLAVSPTMAAMCADDYLRTTLFLRGLHDAIDRMRHSITQRPVHVLYAGCGPYATLAVPLMTLFGAREACFTLLDLNPLSIDSAKSVVETLGLAAHVTGYQVADAAACRIAPQHQPDIILAEVMQNCLGKEPQVGVARHLLRQAPDARLVPEEIGIDLLLADPSREFDIDTLEREEAPRARDRIPVGRIFTLDRQQIASWEEITGKRLPAATVALPVAERRYRPLLFTTIRTFGNHRLQDYDSGLTLPVPLENLVASNPGERIRFHYQTGEDPRLVGEILPQREASP
ncbi:MAG: hypothetical protein P8Z31_01035 [Gammaproteobacteria bacterium]